MKDSYIDKNGIDSMPNLRDAAELAKRPDGPTFFITTNEELLKDRKELEEVFKIKIRTPAEVRRFKEVS